MCTASASSTPEIIAPPRIKRRGKKFVSAFVSVFVSVMAPCRIKPARIASRQCRRASGACMLEQATTPAPEAPTTRYAYKASLIGAAHQFELTDEGFGWRLGGRAGVWPYADIAAIRLSYRPV